MDLSTREYSGQAVVALRGELDMADAASVAAALTEIVARWPQIIVDLAGLEFIDSSGVAALARARKHARHAGGEVVLAAAQPQVIRLLTLVRLIDAFPIHSSVDEAACRDKSSQQVASSRGPNHRDRADNLRPGRVRLRRLVFWGQRLPAQGR
ncbi:MAG: STAS domain-containing protein [Streptosporangiaceae bacterium]